MAEQRATGSADEDAALLAAAKVMVAVSVRATAAVADAVSPAQLRTLTLLDEHGETNLGDLADLLGIVPSATSRLCAKLVDAGLVLRRTSPASRREVLLRISAAGRRLLAKVNAVRLQRLRAVMAELPSSRRSTVARALRSFADASGQLDEDTSRDRDSSGHDASTRGDKMRHDG
ncbi:MarR family transcriptional regulator [Amycolatopsis minnesotensis]|uniref:HTH marR-type domain-containing protein n=1 Tax=Amycolatopsis minnesotensis TaxID=337894 RepID=A0ABN2R6B2_9PSEU